MSLVTGIFLWPEHKKKGLPLNLQSHVLTCQTASQTKSLYLGGSQEQCSLQ